MKAILLVSALAIMVMCGDNINQLGMTGAALEDEVFDRKNKDKMYVIFFKKVDTDDKPLMAANENQKEGLIKKLNELDLQDFQKPFFQVVEINADNKAFIERNKLAEGACDKRPVIMVKDHGVGTLFNGPLATTKAIEEFKKKMPTEAPKDDKAAGSGDAAAGGDGAAAGGDGAGK